MFLQHKWIAAAAALFYTALCFGQTASQAPAPATPSAVLRPALSDVQAVTAGLNISKWKTSGNIRSATQEDVNSIQRDLGATLPSLLAQADAAPGSVPPAFAAYRNLDALYDVLLRVSQTADMAAPSSEATAIAASLQRLESARAALGDSILRESQQHEADIVTLQREIRAAVAVPVTRKETVIDDGPAKATTRHTRRRRTVTHKKAESRKPISGTATKPSPATPTSQSASH